MRSSCERSHWSTATSGLKLALATMPVGSSHGFKKTGTMILGAVAATDAVRRHVSASGREVRNPGEADACLELGLPPFRAAPFRIGAARRIPASVTC